MNNKATKDREYTVELSSMKAITWNINSVRLRLQQVIKLLREERPDILCLQETKCPDDAFPATAIASEGYPYLAYRGEKGYNGVATISKIPFTQQWYGYWGGRQDCRHIAITLENNITIDNFYVPAGGDIPDASVNDKFAHKLTFLDDLTKWAAELDDKKPAILLGDLNIAPREDDVWSHKSLLNVVSHTPIEVEAFKQVMRNGGWHDAVRHKIPQGKLYSWWSYRAQDWAASDRGRRLDHIWVTPPLIDQVAHARVIIEARSWIKPSDHAPVTITLNNTG